MKRPIMLSPVDGNCVVVKWDDVAAYAPFPHSCVLYFQNGTNREFRNRMCSCKLKKKNASNQTFRTNSINPHDDGKAYESIRVILKKAYQ